MMFSRRFPAIWALLLAMTAACAARKPQASQVPQPGFNLFSKEQDIQLGKEAAAQVRQQYDVVDISFLQNYIDGIGNRLASTPEASESGFPFSFALLNNPEVNAFALPGGPMFIFTELIKNVDNEGELAGVMAHEMSHVVLRHATNQISKQNIIQLPAILASQAAGGSLFGQLLQVGIGLGYNSILLKFSRTDETQADVLGARIMAGVGYDPMQMVRFFEKLEQQGGPGIPEFLSDHPSTGRRVEDVQAVIRTLPAGQYTYSTGNFAQAKQQIAQLPPPSKAPSPQGE